MKCASSCHVVVFLRTAQKCTNARVKRTSKACKVAFSLPLPLSLFELRTDVLMILNMSPVF